MAFKKSVVPKSLTKMSTATNPRYGAAIKKTVAGVMKQGAVNKTGGKFKLSVEKSHGSKANILKQGAGKNLGSRSVKAQGIK